MQKDALPQADQLTMTSMGDALYKAHEYWLKKRMLFNIAVGLAGMAAIILYAHHLYFFDITGIIVWGFVANGLYSLGYVVESFVITKLPAIRFDYIRDILFWAGTLLYCLVSFVCANQYFSNAYPYP